MFLPNPQEITRDEKQLVKAIDSKISAQLKEVSEIKESDKELYVAIFFGKKQAPDGFSRLSNGVFFKDSTSLTGIAWMAFNHAVLSGVSKLNIPGSIKQVSVVLSLAPIDESDVFAVNAGEDKSKVTFDAVEPDFTLDDVVMNDSEKKSLLRALTIITERDLIFKKWGYEKIDKCTKSIICFHGVAGTGKTMCAHAVAHYLGKKLLMGSYNKIQSKFVGEGEKNLAAYFKAAEEQDAVLFIDEADTFLSKRLPSSNENSKHYNSMSNELYQLIENFNGCIVFASNHIKDFDPAVISRIIEPIEFKLPDKPTRIKIIKKLMPPYVPLALGEEEYSALASLTEGFSGRDIRKGILLFVANAAYNHCVVAREKRDEIKLVFSEIEAAFKSVKKAKDDLNRSVSGFSIAGRVSEEAKKNTRLLQIAAHTLWVDGKLEEKEKKLFQELSVQLGVSVDINDRDALPAVEQICSAVINKQEKIQMFDIACRMAAIDGSYPDEEKNFIRKIALLLGFTGKGSSDIDSYVGQLVSENHKWTEITSDIRCTEHDILTSLCKEYSEASSWNKLGTAYLDGTEIEGVSLPENKSRAIFCFQKAKDMGYALSQEAEKILSEDDR